MADSIQKKLDRVRAPKVQIKYDVESYGAIEKKELPFAMGVMADLSGDTVQQDAKGNALKIKDKRFYNVDPDEFNNVLRAHQPTLQFSVENKIGSEGGSVPVSLKFDNLDDFAPEQIAKQVDPIQKLVEARMKLASLKQKMDGNDDLEHLVDRILADTSVRDKIKPALDTPEES